MTTAPPSRATQQPDGVMDLASFRALFPALRNRAYLFSGSLAPAAEPVRAAWDHWSDAWSSDPNAVMTEPAMLGEMAALRGAFGQLIGATADEIALVDNTSRAANLAVRILAAQGDGHVLVDDTGYPSSVYPWRAMGREVLTVPAQQSQDPSAALAEAITDQTLAVCVSHVAPFSGLRHDIRMLARAAHARGALLLVDAAQSAGVVPLDVAADGIDVLVTTGMKWLLGPPGLGYLYVSRELLGRAPVLDVGYIGLDVPLGDWPVTVLPPISQSARRYELGLPALPGLAAARAGIEVLMKADVAAVSARSEQLTTRCIDGLLELGQPVVTPVHPARRAGVIVFGHEQPGAVFEACRAELVDVGILGPQSGVRVDPHGFNNEDDIDRFLRCYEHVARS